MKDAIKERRKKQARMEKREKRHEKQKQRKGQRGCRLWREMSSHSTEKKIGSYDDVLLRKKMGVGKT